MNTLPNQHWVQILSKHWGLSGQLDRLDGEYDLNFRVRGDISAILKVMRPGCEDDLIDLQCSALSHMRAKSPDLPIPGFIPAQNGQAFIHVADEDGEDRIVWLQEWKSGKIYASFKPHSAGLLEDLGTQMGEMDKALADFSHPALLRDFKWNLTQGDWINDELDVITDPARHALLQAICEDFSAIKPQLECLPSVAIHNDINDYNLLVSASLDEAPKISGMIDLGDMCAAPRICDLAIAAAYIVLDHENPQEALLALARGYHERYPLTEQELAMLWPLLRMRLAVSVVNSTLMAQESNDPYVTISQAPAWRFLETNDIDPSAFLLALRIACGFPVSSSASAIATWLTANRGTFAPVMGKDLRHLPVGSLSVEACTSPRNPFEMSKAEAATLGADIGLEGSEWLGFYGEPRLVYTDRAFYNGPWKASNRRTVHLGIDIFMRAGTPVHTPMAASIHHIEVRDGELDYGGMVVLRHETAAGDVFFTLYGHLAPSSIADLKKGQMLDKGQAFATLGAQDENGGWDPHLHFQMAITLDAMGDDWPGVSDPDAFDLWSEICPNPAALLNLADDATRYQPTSKASILKGRKEKFGKNLKLTYSDPVMFVRGWKHHLFDEWGRPYLDSYNNVPHVGHAHPRIQAIAADQLKRMNSNTRYLHPAQIKFADKILSKMPDHLDVVFFVNSGTEANELALRLARAKTGGKDMVTSNHGYHGNTTGVIDISAYKFNAPGGVGQPDWVQLVDVADDYRGPYRRDDDQRAEHYADQVKDAIERIHARGGKLAGFIAETFPSVGGQIIPPKGYLARVYDHVRAAGGVCIADEVQTGLGRLGDYYFAFIEQEASPDIVVLGKPIGNGHPIGVLVTTREIADAFAQGPEYFSTFGGSTLSCRMGKEVLDIVDDEGLMENAKQMGERLLSGLRALQKKHVIVGDVRGYGLFIGLDLVMDRSTCEPGTKLADYVKNRMRDHRILMGTEGPADNILKIRPPLTIEANDVDMILHVMDQVLEEATQLAGL
ncbi:MAG: aminotransferase class III-fold pyridoxal phosphate-dependent enzyme [Cohaesibacter sp.]|jgi:4-aminobutyrate aminotransferase-like enzyme/Ser/Thr protein kinase RdoA (MazF antagonist)|nr:aminotransferase class III-fold pyridoxal phosphate-dependent enzyme [Cohaesibacter sp.]